MFQKKSKSQCCFSKQQQSNTSNRQSKQYNLPRQAVSTYAYTILYTIHSFDQEIEKFLPFYRQDALNGMGIAVNGNEQSHSALPNPRSLSVRPHTSPTSIFLLLS